MIPEPLSAGINSYYTLVKAGEWDMPIRSDFPRLQFNHVILANIACTTKVSGLQYELFKNRLHQSNEEQKEMLRRKSQSPR